MAGINGEKLVTIHIDGKAYEVPAGANLVDVSKWHADNDIPVFCYHPKMDPVGMCRMCVVEMGMEVKDRETGEIVLNDDGSPQVRWFPKLMTACTQQVSDGLHVRTNTENVDKNRENVLEFLLTSHPLDCPICDKGGECPLQNLTMEHGPGTSRMNFSDKMKLDKHVPLGDLIYLDQERCIQCARCVRFQDEVVGDDVLAFHERGRSLQIITNSEPGFDTYFSGNTTDICPVGALTTADFRFGARPWELTEVPSITPHDPSGENISLSMRLDRDFGGRAMIKRVMPRQNEYVNEIWISDKTRFGHHFTRSEDRLTQPMTRRDDMQIHTAWDQVLPKIAEVLQAADGDIGVIAGSSLTNEDAWELKQLVEGLGGKQFGTWAPTHGGLEWVEKCGMASGSNLGDLGKGDAVLVIASDLEEEVPIWRLRLKQAQDRGAYLVVANARHTRLEDFAIGAHPTNPPQVGEAVEATSTRHMHQVSGAAIRYAPGEAAHLMAELKTRHPEIAEKLSSAENLVIVAGAEGLTLDGSEALMQAAANFLLETEHAGRTNNGLISTAPGPNMMGLHYLGYSANDTQKIAAKPPKVLIVAQAEILDDDPLAAAWVDQVETIISLSLFPDRLANKAKYALPVQSFAERDGTWVNGEKRIQRFYTAQGPMGEALPAWKILAQLRELSGQGRAKISAAAVMLDIGKNVKAFDGIRYRDLAKVEKQFPDVGGDDLYYGGTSYKNTGGLGVQIPATTESGRKPSPKDVKLPEVPKAADGELLIIPSTRLYNRANDFKPSVMVHPRVLLPFIMLNPADAETIGVSTGDVVKVEFDEFEVRVRASVREDIPAGTSVLPRHLTEQPTPMQPVTGVVTKVAELAPAEA